MSILRTYCTLRGMSIKAKDPILIDQFIKAKRHYTRPEDLFSEHKVLPKVTEWTDKGIDTIDRRAPTNQPKAFNSLSHGTNCVIVASPAIRKHLTFPYLVTYISKFSVLPDVDSLGPRKISCLQITNQTLSVQLTTPCLRPASPPESPNQPLAHRRSLGRMVAGLFLKMVKMTY